MKSSFFLLAITLLIACGSATKHKTFKEGTIEYQINYPRPDSSLEKKFLANSLIVKIKKDKLYFKLHGGFAELKPQVLIDMKKQELMYPNYYDSTVLPKSIASLDNGNSFSEIGKGDNILGFSTTRYKATNGENEYIIDAANDIPVNISNTIILEGFCLSSFNKLPLQVQVKEPDFTCTIRATSSQQASVPDSVFAMPKGFRIKRP